jgi:hypothetical protein
MRFGCALLVAVLGASPAWAQQAISARSGMIHYIEGDVAINGTATHPKFAEFPEVKNGEVLSTEEGRAEVLLTPGVFLRLAENSSVRMISNSLTDTRVEVVSGSALIEAGELLPNNAITFQMKDTRIAIPRRGLYRIDADNERLAVFDGQALVTSGTNKVFAKKGHQVTLAGDSLSDEKFDVKATDPFYRWSSRRAQYIAEANVTSAHVAANSDYRSSFSGGSSTWNWNPWFGMYTYMPASGVYWSPFGPAFYSPGVIGTMYVPARSFRGTPGLSSGSAVPTRSAPARSSVPVGSGFPSGGGHMGSGGFGRMAGPRGR